MNTFQSCVTNHFLSGITNKRILAKGRKREVPVIGMNGELIRKKVVNFPYFAAIP